MITSLTRLSFTKFKKLTSWFLTAKYGKVKVEHILKHEKIMLK
jgi:hypothetical protein